MARRQVLGTPVAVAILRSDTQCGNVGDQRYVQRALQLLVIEIAIAGLDIAFCIECRLFRIDQHGAADSVTAEQRTLRPLEHLEIGEVEGRDIAPFLGRSEERRVGEEWVSSCRFWGWQYH